MRNLSILLIIAVCAALSWYTFISANFPYRFIFFYWVVAFVCLTILFKPKTAIFVCVNLATVFLTLALFESYLWWSLPPSQEEIIFSPHQLFASSDILGYMPKKSLTTDIKKLYQDELVFSATYTINEYGLRVAPPHNPSTEKCILFFGGSFTFGEGVYDHETLPYQVGIKTKGAYQIHNFGFGGYGPHQMLAAIEHGKVDSIVDCEVKHVVYQGILHHIQRVAGLTWWDQHGPRYALRANEVIGAGTFSSNPIYRAGVKSLIYRNVRLTLLGEDEVDLYVGIVTRSEELVAEMYPKSEFHVLLWEDKDVHYSMAVEKLTEKGLHIVDVPTALIPPERDTDFRYLDYHPRAVTYDILAERVLSTMLMKE